jgi:ATP-dependent Lon protease
MDDSSMLELAVLPLGDQVLFPNAVATLTIGRSEAVQAIEQARREGHPVALVAQRDPETEATSTDELYTMGTAAEIQRASRISSDQQMMSATVRGKHRIEIAEEVQRSPYMLVRARIVEESKPDPETTEHIALKYNVQELFEQEAQHSSSVPEELGSAVRRLNDGAMIADLVASALSRTPMEVQQELLETLDVDARLRRVTELLLQRREQRRLQEEINKQAKSNIEDTQREMYLREQMRAIRRELGEEDGPEQELEELRKRLDEAALPEAARKEADRELSRLRRIPQASPEYSVARTYLDWLASMPWHHSTAEPVDLERAQQILDEDHYDLERVKERVLEYLAVYRLKSEPRGPILCFLGPPGVGKTSMGRSIARATGREFVRVSVGGTRDEAEIRGHRRTYVGALPGQIIRGLQRAGTNDPVFMLDEIDKLGADFRGDPAAAMLEVLDPEQNRHFRDHYLDVPFDLSKVLFIATANSLEPIRPTLRDRMETIELPGYVDEEKREIAKNYLIPKQVDEHGLQGERDIQFSEDAIETIIRGYTHEAGVRDLERNIGAVCRKHAKDIVQKDAGALQVDPDAVRSKLGVPRYRVERQLEQRTSRPGVAVAVAWTSSGGDLLFIEAARKPRGSGEFTVTGQIREVMQESARTAMSWLQAHGERYGIQAKEFRDTDVHVHVPEGAVPKDGPSAGVVMVTGLVSLFTDKPVRPYVGMTGEITLSGLVLPIGGVREKILTASRYGMREVILPADNRPNVLEEVPEHLRKDLELHFVETIEDAVDIAFEHPGSRSTEAGKTDGPDDHVVHAAK